MKTDNADYGRSWEREAAYGIFLHVFIVHCLLLLGILFTLFYSIVRSCVLVFGLLAK